MTETAEEAPEHNGPPWIRPERQQHIEWRDDDIVISVPVKSGTTWTMNIVYQLLVGGNAGFDDVYAEVPWIEFVSRPDQPVEELLDLLASMPASRPRAFKTHSAPPDIPFFKAGTGKRVRYIVVFRNPEESLVSFRPFLGQHTDAWFDLWQMPKEEMTRDNFPDFYNEIVNPRGMQGMLFGFLAAWWPLRHESNVLFMHYNEMKQDQRGSLQKIAGFLDIEPSPTDWPKILEYTSFDWMKRHEEKFEAHSVPPVPILQSGAMIRKGQAGQSRAEGMTEEIAAHLREVGSTICPIPEAVDWFYTGGPLP